MGKVSNNCVMHTKVMITDKRLLVTHPYLRLSTGMLQLVRVDFARRETLSVRALLTKQQQESQK